MQIRVAPQLREFFVGSTATQYAAPKLFCRSAAGVNTLRAFMHISTGSVLILDLDSMCFSSRKVLALALLVKSANGLSNQDIGFTQSDRPSYRAYLSPHDQSTALPAPERGPEADRPAGQDLALWLIIVNYRLSAAFSREGREKK